MTQAHKTGVRCNQTNRWGVCEGEIVAEVGLGSAIDACHQVFGARPEPNENNPVHVMVHSFHCDTCQVMFHGVPGKPEAAKEIIRELTGKFRAPYLGGLVGALKEAKALNDQATTPPYNNLTLPIEFKSLAFRNHLNPPTTFSRWVFCYQKLVPSVGIEPTSMP